MRFAEIEASQWKEVKSIYMEAFPKRERKPFFVLKHSVKRGKARVFTASDERTAGLYRCYSVSEYGHGGLSGRIRKDPEQRDRKLHHAGDMPVFFR